MARAIVSCVFAGLFFGFAMAGAEYETHAAACVVVAMWIGFSVKE